MAAFTEATARIQGNLRSSELSLSGLGLTTVAPLMPLLAQMKNLRSLDVSANQLAELPADLGAALPRLVRLDMSDNPIPAVRNVVAALRGLPELRSLRITLRRDEEEDQLIIALPDLERFNGTSLVDDHDDGNGTPPAVAAPSSSRGPSVRGRGSKEPPRATYWTTEDSRGAEALFAEVTEASAHATYPPEFFDYLGRVSKHVTCLTAADDDPLCQEGEVLKARRLLFEYCFEEMARAVGRKDPAMGRGLAALVHYNADLLDGYDTHWRRISRDRDARLTLMKKDMRSAIKKIESLMVQVADGEPAAATDGFADPGTDGLFGHDGDDDDGAAAAARRPSLRRGSPPTRPADASAPASRSHGGPSRAGAAGKGDPRAKGSASRGQAPHSAPRATPDRPRRADVQSHDADTPAALPSPARGKVLTLKQLKDTIDDIYASKTRYDVKCKEGGLPRETMEQHMYTFLNQRYGLREIIQDWATAVAQGVKHFAADDNDVAVFGKILRNDIDEEFRYVQRQLRDTVRELVRTQIKTRHPLKVAPVVNATVEKKMTGSLNEAEWTEIVRYMYNREDAVTLVALVRKTIHSQAAPSRARRPAGGRPAGPSPTEDNQILYREFLHLLLDFQLEGHERFLAPYAAVFREYDSDGNGIVNTEEFKMIAHALDNGKSEGEIDTMASLIDPFGSQLITFSETVTFLSDELVRLAQG